MKIIVINALSALRGGGQTYIKNILENLPESDYKILLIVNTDNEDLFVKYASEKIFLFVAKWASKNIFYRSLWEILFLPNFLINKKANIYFAPGGIMITKIPPNITSATALRNMLPFDARERKRFPFFSYIRFKLWLARYIFLWSYKLSDKVIFISEQSKSVVQKYISNIDIKSVVITHGLNNLFLHTELANKQTKYTIDEPFYLYVSILDVYKAQKELIKTWNLLIKKDFPYPLILAGPKYNQYGEEVIKLIDELGLSKKVIYLGPIAYEELPALYKSARALIFASSCECCPNILLEKLAAGKTTFCSNIQPMPEFGGDAVVYFDPYNPTDLVEKILETEKNPQLMAELSSKAYQQALKFDWKKTTQDTINFLLN